jgi:adenylyltransferase/sulfurtransferase
MDDASLLRYSRQILLPQIGVEGQQRLIGAHALVIGMGGLGSPVAMYLAAAGVGSLALVDDDRVDLSNLQRQIVHATADIGRPKVESARARLQALNPHCRVETHASRLEETALQQAIAHADIVLDCCDNFDTRFQLNRLCHASATPLVSGAAIRWEGQVATFLYGQGDPCYHCLYGGGEDAAERCSENGVIAPLVGVIGSLQALEALKVLCGVGDSLRSRLLIFDGLHASWRTLRLRADPGCPVCAE